MGLHAGAEEQLPVSSMLTVFHWSAASSSILMSLPGFPFCFETGWVSQSDVVSVFFCAQVLFLFEGGVKCEAATLLSFTWNSRANVPVVGDWVSDFIFLPIICPCCGEM